MKVVFLITDMNEDVICAVEDAEELSPTISEIFSFQSGELTLNDPADNGIQNHYSKVHEFVNIIKKNPLESATLVAWPKTRPGEITGEEFDYLHVIPVRLVEHVHRHNVYMDGTLAQTQA